MSERVLIDTSAVLPFLVADDMAHERAVSTMRQLSQRRSRIVTTSYILAESYALVARRVGLDGLTAMRTHLAPLFEVVWMDETRHERALDRLLLLRWRRLSIVDCSGIVVCEERGIDTVFAFDRHFERAGLTVLG